MNKLKISIDLLCGIVFILIVCFPIISKGQTVNICEEVEKAIFHPAQYATEKIRKNDFKTCLIKPACCTPLWGTIPLCYLLKKKKVKDAWTEIKTSVSCKDYNAKDALSRWATQIFNPVPGFTVASGSLANHFGIYIEAAKFFAKPLPDSVKERLLPLVDKGEYPFTKSDIDAALFISSNHNAVKLLKSRDGFAAITYYDLIIVDDFFLNRDECALYANWGHEVVHVHQYRKKGWTTFLTQYLVEAAKNGYSNISFEKNAEEVEEKILQYCSNKCGPIQYQNAVYSIETPMACESSVPIDSYSEWEATEEIIFKPGFSAPTGANFRAFIKN